MSARLPDLATLLGLKRIVPGAIVIVLFWTPLLAIPTAWVAFRTSKAPETIAALVVNLILIPFVLFPLSVLGCFLLCQRVSPRLVAGGLARSVCQLCAIWVLWNSHQVGMSSMLLLFLAPSLLTDQLYTEVLYDYCIFMLFVPAPMVICSGGAKVCAHEASSSSTPLPHTPSPQARGPSMRRATSTARANPIGLSSSQTKRAGAGAGRTAPSSAATASSSR